MSDTERRLLDDPITIYTSKPENPEDVILENAELMKELAELWRGHERAIRLLVQVINATVVKRMVESALPIEIVGLRHELDGADKVVTKLVRYSELSRKMEPKPQEGKPVEGGEQKDENSLT